MHHRSLLALGALALSPFVATPAWACGGFFCSQAPIDQAAERIVFSVDDTAGTVSAHVQISYQGSADDFAWILPVPAVPELFTSTDAMFQLISGATQPRFWLDYEEEGMCSGGNRCNGFGGMCGLENAAFDGDPSPSAGAGGVTVVAQQEVGPYQTVTLQATSSTELLDWLQTYNYDLPDDLSPVLDPYVQDGAYFVALRLSNDKDTGDITPIGLTFESDWAMIPIQLTSIAAADNMRLEVYVLGSARSVPGNYLHVQINEAAIDWFSGGSNYEDVITQAANEAGGQAFATDFAGSTDRFDGLFYQEGRYDLAALRALSDPADFVQSMLSQGFPRSSMVQNLIRAFIPMPQAAIDAGISERSFYNCLSCYDEYLTDLTFDPNAFADELDEFVVAPLQLAEETFSNQPYLTRLTSSMSANEMTLDPDFVFNTSLPDVDNQRTATLVIECAPYYTYGEAPRRLELSDGRVIRLPPQQWIFDNNTSDDEFLESLGSPAAQIIEDTGPVGRPLTVWDRTIELRRQADRFNRDTPGLASGCAATPTPPLWALSVLLIAFRRRRRR